MSKVLVVIALITGAATAAWFAGRSRHQSDSELPDVGDDDEGDADAVAESEPVEPEPEPTPEPEPQPEPEPIKDAQGDPLADEASEDEQPATGAGSLDPHAGWDHPEDTTMHGDPESGLYHTPDSPGYNVGPDVVEFETEEAAQSAGFTRWDEPR